MSESHKKVNEILEEEFSLDEKKTIKEMKKKTETIKQNRAHKI